MSLFDWWRNQDQNNRIVIAASVLVGGFLFLIVGTIVLSAVFGAFLLDTNNQASAPTALFDHNYDEQNGDVVITHDGGDTLVAKQVMISVDGNDYEWDAAQEIEPGDTTRIEGVSPGDTILITWESPDDDTEVTHGLSQYRIEDTG